MADRMRWAILGTGKIANRFAYALNNLPERAELVAVGSRSDETGRAFAEKYNIPKYHVGYEQVASDPDIDVVYIGTPSVFHLRDASMCLEAGKHVLCEKPLTMNAPEARKLIELARAKHLFLMEAMWTRFFPIHVRVRELLQEGIIGEIHGITVNFVATSPFSPTSRFFDLNLGASAMLDIGSYGVSWAVGLLGRPEQVVSLARFGPTGCDDCSACILKHKNGAVVSVMCSQVSYDVKEAVVFGPQGKIEIHAPWYKPTAMTVHVAGQAPERIEMPLGHYNGYEYEALAVMDCIRRDETECPVMPLDESLIIMETLDQIRAQWGFKYPFEQ